MIKKIALDLGCGNKKFNDPNYYVIGVDISKNTKADIIYDLNKFPWPFKDNSFDLVIASHVIEHLDNVIKVMEEIWRILKKKGKVIIRVPYFSSVYAFSDPTHKHYFTYYSFDYFVENSDFSYYTKARFKIIKREIRFGNLLTKIGIKYFANKKPNVYSFYLSYIFPATELYFELEAIK